MQFNAIHSLIRKTSQHTRSNHTPGQQIYAAYFSAKCPFTKLYFLIQIWQKFNFYFSTPDKI